MSLLYVKGDLLDATTSGYIVQQCNCTTTKAAGLSRAIFQRYPEANTYSTDYHRIPGTISVHNKVINLYGQQKPGKPNQTETAAMRIDWFCRGLAQINQLLQPGDHIGFPYGVGCGLAGGDWNVYQNLLEQFARHRPDVVMTVYQLG